MGFLRKWINLIMSWISTISSAILLNGSYLQNFWFSRGIRQRNPFFSYAFIICMEVLNLQILQKLEQRLWKLIHVSRNGPWFSHLMFVDDVILFVKTYSKTIEVIGKTFQNFMKVSGQCIKFQKSKIVFYINCLLGVRIGLQTFSGLERPKILRNIWAFLYALGGWLVVITIS